MSMMKCAEINVKPVDPAYDIRLYNGYGTQLLQSTAKKGEKIQFNVSSLPNGTYYLNIYDGINPHARCNVLLRRIKSKAPAWQQ